VLRPVATAQRELPQHYPQPGWVEHDAEEIWQNVLAVCRSLLARHPKIATDLGSGGIVPPPLAAWLPAIVTLLVGSTVLLHLEDG